MQSLITAFLFNKGGNSFHQNKNKLVYRYETNAMATPKNTNSFFFILKKKNRENQQALKVIRSEKKKKKINERGKTKNKGAQKCKTYHDMRSLNSPNQLIITTAKDQIWRFIILKSSYFNEFCLMLILFVKFLINVCYKCSSTKVNVNLIQWNLKEKHLLWRQWLLTREFHLKLLVTSWLVSVFKFTSSSG